MRAKNQTGRSVQRGAVAAGVALLFGCGSSSQEHRYGAMLADLGRVAPARASAPDGDGRELFAGAAQLDRAALVGAVLARNPDVESARQAWRGALTEYRRATSLEDPMLSCSFAPLSIGGGADVPFGQEIVVEQKIPFPGKRRLAGEVALAEAEAMRSEVDSVRLELALMASNLYDDYYLAARSLEVNQHHGQLLGQMKKSAEAQYVAGQASQQDPLQAEVELANLERDRITLEAERDTSVAQLNGLLRRSPDAPLPPAAELPAPPGLDADRRELLAQALAHRPELGAAGARIRGGEAAMDLAGREFYPDLGVMGSYNSMWDMPEHRWMFGITLDIPLQRGRRRAATQAAEARTARARSQDLRLRDQIAVEVARAHVRVLEGARVVRLLDERLVPVARDQVRAALAGFSAGKNAFTAVVDAEKNQREVELQFHAARAELWRRVAALDRAVGQVAGLSGGAGTEGGVR